MTKLFKIYYTDERAIQKAKDFLSFCIDNEIGGTETIPCSLGSVSVEYKQYIKYVSIEFNSKYLSMKKETRLEDYRADLIDKIFKKAKGND